MKGFRNTVMIIAIALVLTFFIVYLIEAISPSPDYEDFCGYERGYAPKVDTREPCPLAPMKVQQECQEQKGMSKPVYDEQGCITDYECSFCNKKYNTEQESHAMLVFYISIIVGLLSIVLGLYGFKKVEAVGSGFMLGGIFLIIQGAIRSFQYLGRIGKVVVLGIGLILLILIAYKKMKK